MGPVLCLNAIGLTKGQTAALNDVLTWTGPQILALYSEGRRDYHYGFDRTEK